MNGRLFLLLNWKTVFNSTHDMTSNKETYRHPELFPVGMEPEGLIAQSGDSGQTDAERDDFVYVEW